MSISASPLQIATYAAAVAWPLAAGVGVVLWSKARAARQAKLAAEIDGDLKRMFRRVESRGVPPRLSLVVDTLEEQEALAAQAGKAKTPSPSGAPS